MSLPKSAYQALESVVGKEYISDDPAITACYFKEMLEKGEEAANRYYVYPFGMLPGKTYRPECVVLPGTTEEVQAIIKLANRYKFNFIPVGSLLFYSCIPSGTGYITIDPKRMGYLEIDEKNMYAVVEPYTSFAQLQVEAMKKGLTCHIPWSGSQTSVIANHVFAGIGPTDYRYGIAARGILAIEWVLPNGEILRTGSAGLLGAGSFLGEGPGPDLRGLLRCNFGGMGVCTKMAVKLHPWAGPDIFPVTGMTPEKRCIWPQEKVKGYMISFPTNNNAADAMYEIGRAEIGTVCFNTGANKILQFQHKSVEEYWKDVESRKYREEGNLVFVVLVGLSGEKQLNYEEKVLRQIVSENNGRFLPKELLDIDTYVGDCFRVSHVYRVFRLYEEVGTTKLGIMDSLDHSFANLKAGYDLIKICSNNYQPPLLDSEETTHWVMSYEYGHYSHIEQWIQGEANLEGMSTSIEMAKASMEDDIKSKRSPVPAIAGGQIMERILEPVLGDVVLTLVRKIKKSFDPNNVSNPPYPVSISSKED